MGRTPSDNSTIKRQDLTGYGFTLFLEEGDQTRQFARLEAQIETLVPLFRLEEILCKNVNPPSVSCS
jgi:hypothetical protein